MLMESIQEQIYKSIRVPVVVVAYKLIDNFGLFLCLFDTPIFGAFAALVVELFFAFGTLKGFSDAIGPWLEKTWRFEGSRQILSP